jgi:hypothetical protein
MRKGDWDAIGARAIVDLRESFACCQLRIVQHLIHAIERAGNAMACKDRLGLP